MTRRIYAHAERCTGCQACEVACENVHGSRTNVSVVSVRDRFAVPLMCRHCDPAPCIAACYAGALVWDNGAVAFEAARCTGCGLCVLACPFGAIGWDRDGRSVHHCDLCAQRQAAGLLPACALTCPAGALSFEVYEEFVERVQERAAGRLLRAAPPGLGRW